MRDDRGWEIVWIPERYAVSRTPDGMLMVTTYHEPEQDRAAQEDTLRRAWAWFQAQEKAKR